MTMDEREELRALYRRYWEAMIAKDVPALRAMMAEDYTLRHMTGTVQTREEFLRELARGTFHYYSAAHDEIAVTLRGDTAEFTGKSRVEAAVYGGGRHLWHLRGDFTARKEPDGWRLTLSRASTY